MSGESWRCQTLEQLENCFRFLRSTFPEQGWRVEFKIWRDSRSLSQNSFQHAIYEDISRYLITRGRTDCTPEWVKDAVKNKFLGWVDKEYVDIITGARTTRQVLRSTKDLDVGEAVHYTDQLLEWASSIGCEIKIPALCEYRDCKEAQTQ
jgi:hypothetical protein